MLKNSYLKHTITIFLVAFASFRYPLLYPVLLLDMLKQSNSLFDLLRAIRRSFKQLFLAFILGIICIYIFATPQQSSMRVVEVFRSLTKKCTVMIIMHFDLHKRTLKIVVSCTYGAYLYEVSILAGALLLFRSKM